MTDGPSTPPHPIDYQIGRRIMRYRFRAGMSQAALGEPIGVTAERVQLYESGRRRIDAKRLFEIAAILDVPVSSFFETPPRAEAQAMRDRMCGPARLRTEMLNAFEAISSHAVRRQLLELLRSLAD